MYVPNPGPEEGITACTCIYMYLRLLHVRIHTYLTLEQGLLLVHVFNILLLPYEYNLLALVHEHVTTPGAGAAGDGG